MLHMAIKNLNHFKKFICFQANLYELPFKENSFDYVYSLGVLQHTPNVELSFKTIILYLKNGGKLCVDFFIGKDFVQC